MSKQHARHRWGVGGWRVCARVGSLFASLTSILLCCPTPPPRWQEVDVKKAEQARKNALFGEGTARFGETPVDNFDVISFGQSIIYIVSPRLGAGQPAVIPTAPN